jgi:hypothetical protein
MAGSRDRFGLVFLLLATGFLLSAFVSEDLDRIVPPLLYATATVSGRSTRAPSSSPPRSSAW